MSRRYESRTTTDWAEGSTQLISARCWRRCGPWDERFFLYSEETEFDLRAADHGFATLFVPEADAVHLGAGRARPRSALLMVNRVRHCTGNGTVRWPPPPTGRPSFCMRALERRSGRDRAGRPSRRCSTPIAFAGSRDHT